MGVLLSEILDAVNRDEDLRKLASQRAGEETKEASVLPGEQGMATSMSPAPESGDDAVLGGSEEDKKVQLRDQLAEVAGAQQTATSMANPEEELNTDNKPQGGAIEVMPPAAPPQMGGAELAAAVEGAVGEMPMEEQKAAAAMVIEKLSSYFVEEYEEAEKQAAAELEYELEKEAEEEAIKLASEWDALGRIAARAYYDELSKLAAAYAEGEEEQG
jgi:hypothetical protein